jgi:hypothetical protein
MGTIFDTTPSEQQKGHPYERRNVNKHSLKHLEPIQGGELRDIYLWLWLIHWLRLAITRESMVTTRPS